MGRFFCKALGMRDVDFDFCSSCGELEESQSDGKKIYNCPDLFTNTDFNNPFWGNGHRHGRYIDTLKEAFYITQT